MAISALIGNPPATQNDLDIVKGIHAQAGMTLADPSKGVALSPAPSIIPSYANKGPAIIVGLIIAMIFIITITGGRILARYKYKAPTLGRDDALIVVGAAGAISWLGIAVAMVIQGGVGQHVYNLSYMDYYQFSRYRSIDAIVYPVTVSLIQMSILYFNWRLLGATSKVRLWTLPAFFVAIICYLLLALFLSIFTCSPVAAGFSLITYGRDAGNVKCLNARTTTSTIGVFHFALNWMLLEIPTTILFRSKISTVLKFRCIIPLSLGVLACISPIMRLYYQVHPSEDITCKWIQMSMDVHC